MKPKIVFTGGGTAGHVTPNLALMQAAKNAGWTIDYIGSKNSIEEAMMLANNTAFYAIHSGKLRRYFSWKNFFDPFRILLGIGQACRLLRQLETDVVFSKGGFVAFPVVVAAWLNRIPVVAHESDISPGLANRLSFPFVDKICVTFDAAKQHFKQKNRVEVTGTPIRKELFEGSKQRGLALCGFNDKKPCLLVMGGSQGASTLNKALREALQLFKGSYQVIHLCGKGKVDSLLTHHPDYCQFEYADAELPDLFAAADIVVSRAGANSLYEILALQKPHVLVPLSAKVSRGDQIQNARFFSQQGISTVIDDDVLTADKLITAIHYVYDAKDDIIAKIQALHIHSATATILTLIKERLDAKCQTTA